jgi:HlyD family secretion protein
MPVELMIKRQSRTVLSFFVKPLTDQLARTFRED